MVLSARTRLERLESQSAPTRGRVFRVVGGAGFTGEAEDFLRTKGHVLHTNDVVVLRTICRPSGSGSEVLPSSMRWVVDPLVKQQSALGQR